MAAVATHVVLHNPESFFPTWSQFPLLRVVNTIITPSLAMQDHNIIVYITHSVVADRHITTYHDSIIAVTTNPESRPRLTHWSLTQFYGPKIFPTFLPWFPWMLFRNPKQNKHIVLLTNRSALQWIPGKYLTVGLANPWNIPLCSHIWNNTIYIFLSSGLYMWLYIYSMYIHSYKIDKHPDFCEVLIMLYSCIYNPYCHIKYLLVLVSCCNN